MVWHLSPFSTNWKMSMKTLLLLSAIAVVKTQECNYLIDDQAYNKTEILQIDGLPTNLVFNSGTGDLFFTLIDIPSLLNNDVETEMDEYILNEEGIKKIDNFKGQCATMGSQIDIVIFGTDSGLYRFDEINKIPVPIRNDGDYVYLFKTSHNPNLYCIMYPENEVYVETHEGNRTKIEDLPTCNMVLVDRNDNIYFQSEKNGLGVLLKGFREPFYYVGLKTDIGRALAAYDDRILAATSHGVYELRPDNVIPRKIADFDFVPSGMFYHNGDFYISTSGKIFKFSKEGC